MHHELLLHAAVPAHRHPQLLALLAGICAHAPHPHAERHHLFTPSRPPARAAPRQGASQSVVDEAKARRLAPAAADAYALQVVCETASPGAERWSIVWTDVPEPGGADVTSRAASGTAVEGGDIFTFMRGIGYRLVRDYVLDGHRFVHGNVVLYLFRILTTEGVAAGERGVPMGDVLPPLDEHGGYVVEALVRLSDGKDTELLKQGAAELRKVKDLFEQCLDFRQVDRLSLDTRVR